MKFISIYFIDPAKRCAGPPSEEEMGRMGQLIGETMSAGALLDTGGVMNGGMSVRAQRNGSKMTITDGPFTEAKEVIGGYAVFNVASKDEMLTWTERFLDCAGDGTCEIHELFEPPNQA